jgi:hypothetical protein
MLEGAIVSRGSRKACRLCVEVTHGLRNYRKQFEPSPTGWLIRPKDRFRIMLDIITSHQPYPQEFHTLVRSISACGGVDAVRARSLEFIMFGPLPGNQGCLFRPASTVVADGVYFFLWAFSALHVMLVGEGHFVPTLAGAGSQGRRSHLPPAKKKSQLCP